MSPRWRLGCLFIVYLLYLFMGATIFSAIEHPIERRMLGELGEARKKFLAKHSHDGVKALDLDEYVADVVSSSRRGVTLADKDVPNWSFGQSFFFSATVITTIGYGQQTPLSPLGKMFCMLYSILGIPLTLLLLTAMVDHLMFPVTNFLSYLNSRLGHLHSPFRIRIIHLLLVGAIVMFIFLLIPASILDSLEPNWTWFDSFYYCFISLTTVGLGDFIPGDEPGQTGRSFYKTTIAVYLVLGVTGMMLILRVFHSIPELDFSGWFRNDVDTDDPEKQRLSVPGQAAHQYGQELEEGAEDGEHRRVVRARSRREDSEEGEDGIIDDTTPVHNNRRH